MTEMIGVSRWTIHRRVTGDGLEGMRGLDSLPDKELKSFKSTFLTMGALLDITSLQVSLSPLGYEFNGKQ